MDIILNWEEDEIKEKLKPVGCKPGSETRILNTICATKSYRNTIPEDVRTLFPSRSTTNKKKKSITVNNKPMPEKWKPSETDKDLTEEFRKPDNSSSIRYTCTQIRKGHIPSCTTKGVNTSFYVNSSRYKRYFRITVTWND